MLDLFLNASYQNNKREEQIVKLSQDLRKLPDSTLLKLASGTMKLSFHGDAEWLEKYRGTTLFDEAIALEKADLEAEVARQTANQNRPDNQQFYDTQDQIRLQKKMLDLKLVELQEQNGLGMKPGGELATEVTPTAQGAGALGDSPPEGVQDAIGGTVGSKTGSATKQAFSVTDAGHKFDAADYRGREHHLGQRQEARDQYGRERGGLQAGHTLAELLSLAAARPELILGLGRGVGQLSGLSDKLEERHMNYAAGKHEQGSNAWNPFGGVLTPTEREKHKEASINFEKAALSLKTLGEGAIAAAKANPVALAGAGVGAVGGAIAGGPDHRLSGALGGATLGAGAGHLGARTHAAHTAGLPLGDALRTAASEMSDHFKAHVSNAMSRVGTPSKPAELGDDVQKILAEAPPAPATAPFTMPQRGPEEISPWARHALPSSYGPKVASARFKEALSHLRG